MAARRSKGATLLEFSATIGIVLLFIFGILEVSRYLILKTVLVDAAQLALSLAQKNQQLLCDTRLLQSTSQHYLDFKAAREDIIGTVALNSRASIFIGGSSSPSAVRFMPFTAVDELVGSSEHTQLDGTILRPGDRALLTSSGEEVTHPSYCKDRPGCMTPARMMPVEWAELLKLQPLYVEFRITYRPLLPLIDWEWPIRAVAVGYAETPLDIGVP